MAQSVCLEENLGRLDVPKIMVFTNFLGPISRKIQACVNGVSFNIMMVEDVYVSLEKGKKFNVGSISPTTQSNDDDVDTTSDSCGIWEVDATRDSEERGKEVNENSLKGRVSSVRKERDIQGIVESYTIEFSTEANNLAYWGDCFVLRVLKAEDQRTFLMILLLK